jgi:hypothetical protein
MRIHKALLLLTTTATIGLAGCGTSDKPENWQEADKKLVIISPYIDSATGERFLNVIYENFSEDTIRKLKYELIAHEAGKVDTIEKEIILKKRLLPKDRHLVTRTATEKPVTYERVESGKVWIVK